MIPYDKNSKELDELIDAEEERIRDENGGSCPGPVDMFSSDVSRRGLLLVGVGGLLSMLFAQWLDPAGAMAATAPGGKKAKNCILLWMNGGPSHLENWDPKPGAATGGPTKAIKTRVPGIEVSQNLVQCADVADHLAIIRGMSSKEGNHQRAQYLLHTGYSPNPTVTHPSLGGWVNQELGDPTSDLPNFVSISGPSIGAGFLGVQYGPLVIQQAGQLPQNIAYASNVNEARFDSRQKAL